MKILEEFRGREYYMKRLIEICFVFCCLGFIYTCAKIRLFGQEKSISEELETIIEDNQLENFLFYSGENAICVYEGISFEINAHKFAVYKETVEKDILFENMLFIEHDTGDIYTWGGEELKKLTLINSFNMDEFEGGADILAKDTSIDRVYERDEIEPLMSEIIDLLMQDGSRDLEMIYDGTTDLINKKYFGISLMEDFEDHIVRSQHYYLDVESGNLYVGGEDVLSLRTELYYIGNIKE